MTHSFVNACENIQFIELNRTNKDHETATEFFLFPAETERGNYQRTRQCHNNKHIFESKAERANPTTKQPGTKNKLFLCILNLISFNRTGRKTEFFYSPKFYYKTFRANSTRPRINTYTSTVYKEYNRTGYPSCGPKTKGGQTQDRTWYPITKTEKYRRERPYPFERRRVSKVAGGKTPEADPSQYLQVKGARVRNEKTNRTKRNKEGKRRTPDLPICFA